MPSRYGSGLILLPRYIPHTRQQHLKDIVSVCEASQPAPTTGERTVTMRELVVAAQTSPYLLGEDRPMNMERLMAAEYRIPPRPAATARAAAPAAGGNGVAVGLRK